jgi:hypothetical protein
MLISPAAVGLTLDGSPAHWDVFIMPGNNAIGRSDSVMHDGYYSVLLHTPNAYAKDPINNWSQVIYDNLIDIPLTLTGSIRTEEVGEAAFWIQCFSKKRSRILASATSSTNKTLSGTHGWTQVSAEITPPPGTDFIMVRCVIQGKGKAWFDSLSLSVVDPVALEAPIEDIVTEPLVAPGLSTEDFMAASKIMQDTIARLELTNQALLKELTEIQKDLDQYRREVEQQQAPLKRPRGLHPLVPVDYESPKEPINE